MNILITNDDGVNSTGIIAAKNAVDDLGEVTIVAPATQQSGIGRALTLFEPIRVYEINLKDGTAAYSISGTPTDCILVGIFKLLKTKPDLVISGINLGANIGIGELTTSGTIGAAIEAAVNDIPALAVSLEAEKSDLKFHDGEIDINFTEAEKITKKVAANILDNGMPKEADILNLNIPIELTTIEPKPALLGKRMYHVNIEERKDPRGRPYYWIDGQPIENYIQNTDVEILKKQKQPTITPIKLDNTSAISSLENWL